MYFPTNNISLGVSCPFGDFLEFLDFLEIWGCVINGPDSRVTNLPIFYLTWEFSRYILIGDLSLLSKVSIIIDRWKANLT